MRALRYAYVLALTCWLGGMVVLGAMVAPATFEILQAAAPATGRALAGDLFREILARFHLLAYGAGALMLVTLAGMALLGPRPRSFAIRVAIVAAMLAVAVYSGQFVLAAIDQIQAEAGRLPSQLPDGDPRRLRFDALHLLSTRLMMLNLFGGLALLYWEAGEP
jgi:hypothetical protein